MADRRAILTRVSVVALAAVASIAIARHADACSRVFWNDNGVVVITGRTMDWAHHFNDALWVMPKGMKRNGRAGHNSASWTSKFGSVVVVSANAITSEGLNEAGLAVHLLYLDNSKYEARDGRPGVGTDTWAQYLLDNFGSVDEALAHLKDVQVVNVGILGYEKGLPLHYAMEDVSGNSAVVEFIDGKTVVHAGRQYQVMTNEPAYNRQLANLRRYLPFSTKTNLPGNIAATDRFVRAAYFLHYLPKPEDPEEAAAYMMSLVYNISVPSGAPYGGISATYPTWWRDIIDLSNRTIYFNYARSPNVIWVSFQSFDFHEGAQSKRLSVLDPALVGDVAGKFTVALAPY